MVVQERPVQGKEGRGEDRQEEAGRGGAGPVLALRTAEPSGLDSRSMGNHRSQVCSSGSMGCGWFAFEEASSCLLCGIMTGVRVGPSHREASECPCGLH